MTSRYRTLADSLRLQLQTGAYRPGQRLPGELALRRQHVVSRQTVREALFLLADEGLIVPRKGSGWWVVEHAALAQGRPRCVGFPTDPADPVSQHLLAGLREILEPQGFIVRVVPVARAEVGAGDLRAADGLSAVVFRCSRLDGALRREALSLGVPCIGMDCAEHELFDTVAGEGDSVGAWLDLGRTAAARLVARFLIPHLPPTVSRLGTHAAATLTA